MGNIVMEHGPNNDEINYWENLLRSFGHKTEPQESSREILSENPEETRAAIDGLSDEFNHAMEHRAAAENFDNYLPREYNA